MGGKQLAFLEYELTTAKTQTKREKFLSEMEVVVPWQPLVGLIEPQYPKTSNKGGRPPYPLACLGTELFHRRDVGVNWFSSLIQGNRCNDGNLLLRLPACPAVRSFSAWVANPSGPMSSSSPRWPLVKL